MSMLKRKIFYSLELTLDWQILCKAVQPQAFFFVFCTAFAHCQVRLLLQLQAFSPKNKTDFA